MAQYENKGDRLNILLADELPETWTGTQDTQHICGKCAWYSFRKLESTCGKTGKEVAYFANRECFTTDKDMDMEENNNAQPVAETGTQVCKDCGRILPLEDFQRRRNGKIDTVCKACRAEKVRIGIARRTAEVLKDHGIETQVVTSDEAVLEEAVKTERPSVEEVLTKAGLKPYKDGNQWCVLAGDNLQEGLCGFGNTIEDALCDFLLNTQKEQKPAESEDERIRKAIIELLKEVGRDDTGISENAKCMIAYLEKQKEQKPEVITTVAYVADVSDAALLEELRRRGYKGTITKVQEVEI